MEAINDSTKLIASVINGLKKIKPVEDSEENKDLKEAINSLEIALDKLTNKIG